MLPLSHLWKRAGDRKLFAQVRDGSPVPPSRMSKVGQMHFRPFLGFDWMEEGISSTIRGVVTHLNVGSGATCHYSGFGVTGVSPFRISCHQPLAGLWSARWLGLTGKWSCVRPVWGTSCGTSVAGFIPDVFADRSPRAGEGCSWNWPWGRDETFRQRSTGGWCRQTLTAMVPGFFV